jgi:small-conductance mechanosensitive channel
VLRARVLGREPDERARSAERVLGDLVAHGVTGPVAAQPLTGGMLITVGSRVVLGVSSLDVDDLAGETLDAVSRQAVANLQRAIQEAVDAGRPWVLFRAAVVALVIFIIASVALWVLVRARRAIGTNLMALAEKKVTQAGLANLESLRSSRVLDFQRHLVTTAVTIANFVIVLGATTLILRQFPYTRPWGESISGFLLTTGETLALGMANALPGLFTVVIIFTIVRFLVRVVNWWFKSVERGEVSAIWIHPETAQPTRRLICALLWVFGVVVAYPYMPGSQTEAFKGVSVFFGLMVTFGSSGLVNQIMSSFMITYSRAVRIGDFVKIGDVEGTVLQLGILSTKIRTLRNEEATIPNAVVVSNTITDYSRYGDTVGVFTATSVTIGYDTPWRQVEGLLLLAAGRTTGIRPTPKPFVLQAGLEDFYVKYTLFICLEEQQRRPYVLAALHANIQDAFNEFGVQIMSPNYVIDPAAPKVVPKERWFDAPAKSTVEHPEGV